MSWQPLEKLSEILAAEGSPIRVPGAQFPSFAEARPDVMLCGGERIRFCTASIDGTGKVLGVNHAAMHPITVQWTAPNGDARVGVFSPDEFLYMEVLA